MDVYRNDEISVEEAAAYDKIVLSPGPGIPDEAGILKPLIKALAPTHSILGVCLGCQAIAEVFGGQIYNLSKVYHALPPPYGWKTRMKYCSTDCPQHLKRDATTVGWLMNKNCRRALK